MRTCAFMLLSSLFINPSRQFTTRQFPFDKVVVRSIYIVSSYLVRALNFSDPVMTTRSFTITRTSLRLSMHASQVAYLKAHDYRRHVIRWRYPQKLRSTTFFSSLVAGTILSRKIYWKAEAANQLRITDLTITQRLLIFILRKLLLKIKFLPLIRVAPIRKV